MFSHPSKLDLLREATAAGYYTAVHVLMVPEELAVARVAARVAAGGHAVPEDKIRGRYQRLWPLVADAIGLGRHRHRLRQHQARRARVPSPSGATASPWATPAWPGWAPAPLTLRWPPETAAGPGVEDADEVAHPVVAGLERRRALPRPLLRPPDVHGRHAEPARSAHVGLPGVTDEHGVRCVHAQGGEGRGVDARVRLPRAGLARR